MRIPPLAQFRRRWCRRGMLLLVLLQAAIESGARETAFFVDPETEFLVGASANGKWLDSAAAARKLKAARTFRVFSLIGEVASARSDAPVLAGEPFADVWLVPLRPKFAGRGFAVSTSWNPRPRKTTTLALTQPAYLDAARDVLLQHGIRKPKVQIEQLVRVDLEGDGRDEVLLSATNYFSRSYPASAPPSAPEGSYSFVALRRLAGVNVRTEIIAGEFHPKAREFSAPNRYSIQAILDLDGDGTMEVVLASTYYEGGSTIVLRCTPTRMQAVLETGGGA